MSSPKRCLKCLISTLSCLPKRFNVATAHNNYANNYHRLHPHHQLRQPKSSITQLPILICAFVTFSLIVLFSYKGLSHLITTNIPEEQSYPNHDKEMLRLLTFPNGSSSHEQIQSKLDDFDYDYIRESQTSRKYFGENGTKNRKRGKDKPNVFKERKLWMRISDEVFVYSAHLDTRNFTTYPMQNNDNLSTVQGRVGGIATEGQVTGEYGNDDDDDDGGDSDKLKDIFLIRIIGIKGVPPLREFIKKDILDWFRMKHEMEFSEKYECRLFFNPDDDDIDDGRRDENFMFIPSSKVTYTVIEEGVKIYAGTYFNCYFNIAKYFSRISRIIKSTNGGNLQVAMCPKNVSDYPIKLISINNLMKPGQNHAINGNIKYNEKTLAVCVRPLFGPFDSVVKLVQFISYYYAVGITQFNFYSMSISPNVRNFLIKLSEDTWTEQVEEDDNERRSLPRFIIHDWNLPTGNTSELWDYGTLAALNDCLFSNIDQEFVLFVDVDEFIVPQKGLPLQSKMEDHSNPTLWDIIDSHDKKRTHQFLIRNTFFCNEFCQFGQDMNNTEKLRGVSEVTLFPTSLPQTSRKDRNGKATKNFQQLPIFRCITRTKRIWNAALRSKFIVNPRQILSVGHHLVTKYVDTKVDFRFSGRSVQVDPKVAVMNHYRECTSISSKSHPVLTRIKEVDRTMLQFKSRILNFINLLGFIT